MDTKTYQSYLAILNKELKPALGCTEPIAIAYACAEVRRLLGTIPEKLELSLSPDIIKNVQGAVVPHSGGMRGVETAALLGAIGGDPDRKLQVLESVTEKDLCLAKAAQKEKRCTYRLAQSKEVLYIRVEAAAGQDTAVVELKQEHDHLTYREKNGVVLYRSEYSNEPEEELAYYPSNLESIYDFVDSVVLSDVEPLIVNQIRCNTAISQEGLAHSYGANVGRVLMNREHVDLMTKMKAAAAAGSDARMSGCAMPVVINSGSGNQGIAVSLPVIEYAQEKQMSFERLIRALVCANLVSLHIKQHIGKLSAFCGAVSAACGAITGIAYLDCASRDVRSAAIINTLCTAGGIICDGAKPSCSAKIASSLDAAFTAYELAKSGNVFCEHQGLCGADAEITIDNIGRVAVDCLRAADDVILEIMVPTI